MAKEFLTELLGRAWIYTEHRKAKTVVGPDIVMASKSIGHQLLQ
jgi:histone H3/H4